MTLLSFAGECHAAVDMEQMAATPAADAPCSNRVIDRYRLPAGRAWSTWLVGVEFNAPLDTI